MPNGDEDDLPGLEPDPPEPTPSVEVASEPTSTAPEWTDAELNEWFEGPFGGREAFERRFPDDLIALPMDMRDTLFEGAIKVQDHLHQGTLVRMFVEPGWSSLSSGAKDEFRRGWESRFGTDPATWPSTPVWLGYAPSIPAGHDDGYRASEELDSERAAFGGQIDYGEGGPPAIDRRAQGSPSTPRGVVVGAIVAAAGVAVLIGFVALRDSDDTNTASDETPPATQPEPPATVESTPTPEDTGPSGAADEPAPAATADVTASAFPSAWNMTATKTATIVPAPEFISATPIGAVLPWSVAVSETCSGTACTYASTVRPLIPEVVFGEVPEAVWVVDGARWTLDARWFSGQSSFDGTVCLIEDHWTYEFTVIEAELIDGRSVATAFEGTWVQRTRLDLSASTGDLSFCGEPWELADEWSVSGTPG
jgi:hypothetical protein